MLLSKLKLKAGALGTVALMGLAACGSGGGSSQTTALAPDQTLKFPIFSDFGTLDPGLLDLESDSEIAQNIFNGPFRYDKDLNLVPDIATEVPTTSNGGISADGLTYTFGLRKDATFSNGDKVTAKDLLYSWNRAAALKGGYASNLSAIVGFGAVGKAAGKKPKKTAASGDKVSFQQNIEDRLAANDPTFQMSGLTAPDGPTGYKIQVKLSAPAGWFLPAVALQSTTGMIVDQNVIKSDPRDWWSKPAGLVGTGAFKETAYTPKQSVEFQAVPNWYGSPKPVLKKISIDIKDPSTQSTSIAAWEQKSYDIVGYGGFATLPAADTLRIHKSSSESSQLFLKPKGRTTWVSFTISSAYPGGGPFVGTGAAATGLRTAFALAIDKQALQHIACSDILCIAATGGLITKGLAGYGGDNTDPLAKFDATKAKALLKQYDPTGTKTANLKYSFNSGGLNDPIATNLQDQWKTNLGVNVTLDPHPDASAFISDRFAGKFVMDRDGWQFDYNHPQDWYDNLWGKQALDSNASSSGYDSTTYDANATKANALPLKDALPTYALINKELQDNAVYIPLYYSVGQFLIHPYVKGAGTTTQADYYWNEISILQH